MVTGGSMGLGGNSQISHRKGGGAFLPFAARLFVLEEERTMEVRPE